MGFAPILKPGIRRHDELEDVLGDPILAPGAQFLAGLLAARPAPSRSGRFFYTTDEEKLYRDTGAAWQDIVQRQQAIGSFVGARVYRSTAQLIPTSTFTVVNFEAEDFDSDNFWVIGAPSRLTVPAGKAGRYLVIGALTWSAASTLGERSIRLRKNGINEATFAAGAAQTGNRGVGCIAAAIVNAAVGDYFDMTCYQSTALDLNTASGREDVLLACIKLTV